MICPECEGKPLMMIAEDEWEVCATCEGKGEIKC